MQKCKNFMQWFLKQLCFRKTRIDDCLLIVTNAGSTVFDGFKSFALYNPSTINYTPLIKIFWLVSCLILSVI